MLHSWCIFQQNGTKDGAEKRGRESKQTKAALRRAMSMQCTVVGILQSQARDNGKTAKEIETALTRLITTTVRPNKPHHNPRP